MAAGGHFEYLARKTWRKGVAAQIMEQNWLALSQCNSYYHQKLQLKDCRRSLQNIILLRSIAEVSTGCANGKSKMKKDEKHKALFDSIGRQADILYKVSHVSSFMSTSK